MNGQKMVPLGCIGALVMACVAVIAAPAQNVPATARQAAASPQFTARLAQPNATQHKLSPSRRAGACSPLPARTVEGILPFDNILYSNGPINGTTDAWTINSGFVVADSFIVSNSAASGLSFGAWLFPGDVLQSVQVTITSAPFGGTIYSNQVVNITQNDCWSNQYGFNVCTETSTSFAGVNLAAGTYWLNLANAVVNTGDPVYWDENSGPSLAETNTVGTIPSEAFSVYSGGPVNLCMPEQQGSFKVIHDFSGGGDGASPLGLALDNAGNLYGPAQSGGNGNGTVFQMAKIGANWVLRTLYNFVGGASGNSPQGLIVGPDRILYGAATGGIQNCSGQYCGFIFDLGPGPTVCRSTSCGWTQHPLYSFTGPTDAWDGGGLVSDQAGNLYGVSYGGGAQQQGAVFELSPSIGGWAESILYSFTGGSDGANPVDLIVGNDGHLYGMAAGGGANGYGVVFQLTSSGDNWTESILYNIPTGQWGSSDPHALIQDSGGNLYGIYQYPGCCDSATGLIFMLSPSDGNWVFTELHHGNENLDGNDVFPNMALDAAGNLWGTESADNGCINTVDYGYIFELARASGWQFSTPMAWNDTYFHTGGALAIDAQGNLYGTTGDCGTHNLGTVWEFSTH